MSNLLDILTLVALTVTLYHLHKGNMEIRDIRRLSNKAGARG